MSTLADPSDHDKLFGRLAVEQGHITPDQLVEAVLIQGREATQRKLGEILLDQHRIDTTQLLQILDEQRRLAKAAAGGAAGPAGAGAAPKPAVAAGFSSLDQLLREMVARGASDLHLHSGSRPRIRVDGALCDLTPGLLTAESVRAMARAILPEPLFARLEAEGQVDFVHTLAGVGRFRANAYRQRLGVDLVLRAIPPRPPTLESLGLPRELARLTNHHQGLVLITGPSGCGKTSTLAALVNLINEERQVHILTAEEPIEYQQVSRRALVNQREVGTHSDSYARVLRGALREDPDVIALGDLRDHATISLALTAAETGHLVMATMHTGGAIRTINRLVGAFPPNEQEQVRIMVSESLRAIVSQRLVPRKDGRGRVAAIELLIANRAVSNLIRERKTFQIESVLQLSSAEGMCTLDQSLDRLIAAGIVTREAVAFHRPESYLVADQPGASHAAS